MTWVCENKLLNSMLEVKEYFREYVLEVLSEADRRGYEIKENINCKDIERCIRQYLIYQQTINENCLYDSSIVHKDYIAYAIENLFQSIRSVEEV